MRILTSTPVAEANAFPSFSKLVRSLSLVFVVGAVISGCTSGSGSDNETALGGNNGNNNGPGYTGPAPFDADVQAFQINFWNNLVDDNRCGTCHKQDGPGPTAFVRDDDINLAYQAALTVVDRDIPAQSRIVERMNEGHQCWDNSTAVCAQQMEGYITAWLSATSSEATQVTIVPPDALFDPGASLNHPQDPGLFQTHLYDPILSQFCGDCHREDGPIRQQAPFFASTDINTAYDAAKARISLANPNSSRFVERMLPDLHNCWEVTSGNGVSCSESRDAMLAAINAYIAALGTPDSVDPGLLISRAMFFPGGDSDPNDAQPATTQGRFETNVIAKYEFQQLDENDDTRVVDLSLQSPQLDLTLSGDAEFVPNVGVRFFGPNGKAQGSTTNSRKLYDLLTLTNEYSVEAWVVPNNVTQDDTRRIVSYSGGLTERNFTLGQTLYNYDSLNRTTAATSSQNGDILFSTPDADEVLQASLQHVVMSFDPINGRSIYVNGELATAGEVDDQIGSNISNWNPSYVLVVGNETQSQDTDWRGTIRMLAIHNRVMTDEQIQANFDVGVGQRFYIPFDISHLLPGVSDAYIVFEVERFDGYSYLFNKPFFTVLQSGAVLPSDIQIRGMRIGLNGREAPSGQAYAKMDVTISDADYQAAENNWLYLADTPEGLNVQGTIIPAEKVAPEADEFFLSFDFIGGASSTITRNLGGPCPDVNTTPCDLVGLQTLGYEQSDIGLKHFYELNEMYSSVTGVSKDNANVANTFSQVRRQLPSTEDPIAFATSNQMGVAQFAAAYCEELASDAGLRSAMWPTVNFTAALNSQRDAVLQPLLQQLAAHSISGGAHLTTQADPADVATDIDTLLAALSTAQSGSQANGEATAIAVCTAVLSSAIATVQ